MYSDSLILRSYTGILGDSDMCTKTILLQIDSHVTKYVFTYFTTSPIKQITSSSMKSSNISKYNNRIKSCSVLCYNKITALQFLKFVVLIVFIQNISTQAIGLNLNLSTKLQAGRSGSRLRTSSLRTNMPSPITNSAGGGRRPPPAQPPAQSAASFSRAAVPPLAPIGASGSGSTDANLRLIAPSGSGVINADLRLKPNFKIFLIY